MDAFEQLAAELLFANGWWVQTSVKVELTKEEKKMVGRHSSPRWELDVVAYKGATNEILVIECKSFLDSRGVQWCELQDGHSSTRYKLFREPVLREIVLGRLVAQMTLEGRCAPNPKLRLGMMAGKIKAGDEELLPQHFATNGWVFFGPTWLREQLNATAERGYSNQVSAVVAKLLLRGAKGNSAGAGGTLSPSNGRRSKWQENASLKLLVDANPKRPGSQAHARFESYFSPSATTLAGALAAGVRMDDIRNDVAKGYIELG
jgi:hypothetical protein